MISNKCDFQTSIIVDFFSFGYLAIFPWVLCHFFNKQPKVFFSAGHAATVGEDLINEYEEFCYRRHS